MHLHKVHWWLNIMHIFMIRDDLVLLVNYFNASVNKRCDIGRNKNATKLYIIDCDADVAKRISIM